MDFELTLRDVALLGARLLLGGTMAAHGAQKLFGAFGGPGPQKAAQMMHSLGLRPGEQHAKAASCAELASGALIAAGFLGPVGPAILTSVMIVATETVHRPKGYFNSKGGYELNAMYLALAAILANVGYGSLSLDEAIGLAKRTRPAHAWLALAGGTAAAIAILARRQLEQQTTHGETAAPQKTTSGA